MTDYQILQATRNATYARVVFVKEFAYRDIASPDYLSMTEAAGSSGTLRRATDKGLADG